MASRTKEFDRFDKVMDGLLAVPKDELQQEIHREKQQDTGKKPKSPSASPGAARQAGK